MRELRDKLDDLERRLCPFRLQASVDEGRQQVEITAETEEAESACFVTLDMIRYAAFEDVLHDAARRSVVRLMGVRRN